MNNNYENLTADQQTAVTELLVKRVPHLMQELVPGVYAGENCPELTTATETAIKEVLTMTPPKAEEGRELDDVTSLEELFDKIGLTPELRRLFEMKRVFTGQSEAEAIEELKSQYAEYCKETTKPVEESTESVIHKRVMDTKSLDELFDLIEMPEGIRTMTKTVQKIKGESEDELLKILKSKYIAHCDETTSDVKEKTKMDKKNTIPSYKRTSTVRPIYTIGDGIYTTKNKLPIAYEVIGLNEKEYRLIDANGNRTSLRIKFVNENFKLIKDALA